MKGQSKRGARQKDMTARYLSGHVDEDNVQRQQRFSRRSASAEQNKIVKTALMRAAEDAANVDLAVLPLGEVVQVFSVYCEVESAGVTFLAVMRKTLTKTSDTAVIVGDWVRFMPVESPEAKEEAESGQPEAVIEAILPRATVLTRADSFKGTEQHPIVANADQMLIVVSLANPSVKWGLIDRMLVAAQSGKLKPIVCLNKVDLAGSDAKPREVKEADEALAHYTAFGVPVLRTSTETAAGLEELKQTLAAKKTVLAGHSGVGKSSLINAIAPGLNLRIGAISGYTGKGRHTTTSARRYVLQAAGAGEGGGEGTAATSVIDTPGVKMFGLWGVTAANLRGFFPDLEDDTAPDWRRDSFERIQESLPAEEEWEENW